MVLRWSAPDNAGSVYSGAINTLIIACILSWYRLLNVFAVDPSLGPLYFIIVRLFRDVSLWLRVFLIFAVSFQIGFANITAQAGADPTSPYPTGSLPVSFFAIIGDFSYINDVMAKTPLGIALLGIYALIVQVMLVNLLIAMMVTTYSNLSDNSTDEWKFFRFKLVSEVQSTSVYPPPLNLIALSFTFIVFLKELIKDTFFADAGESTETVLDVPPHSASPADQLLSLDSPVQIVEHSNQIPTPQVSKKERLEKAFKKVLLAHDELIKKETKETPVAVLVNAVQERVSKLLNERENDKVLLETRFKDAEVVIQRGYTDLQQLMFGLVDLTEQVINQNQLLLQQQQQQQAINQNQHIMQQQIMALLQQQQQRQSHQTSK